MSTVEAPRYADRITIDPELCNGKPTIRGMRITVQTVLGYLSAGESREEILRQFPGSIYLTERVPSGRRFGTGRRK